MIVILSLIQGFWLMERVIKNVIIFWLYMIS